MKDYRAISADLLQLLPQRSRDIISCRFGLFDRERITLEAIGKEHKVTRERVRQIEKESLKQIKKNTANFSEVFDYFRGRIRVLGGVKRENLFVEEFASRYNDNDQRNYILFLFNVCDDFFRFPENKDIYSAWAVSKERMARSSEVIEKAVKFLNRKKELVDLDVLQRFVFSEEEIMFLISSLEISKKIAKNKDGMYGLAKWPEIKPRGIKDRAYIVLKKEKKPLHFREIANMIGENVNSQTTHNELIKDSRFVLIGRGVYALSEWGYTPGQVKEVIRRILKEEGALYKKEIIVRVSEQRIVKENTIIQNLSNKKNFIRTPDGKYTIA